MTTKEDRNGMTVRLALDKPCTNLLQEVLRHHVPEKDLHKLLNDPAKKRTIIPFVRKLRCIPKLESLMAATLTLICLCFMF